MKGFQFTEEGKNVYGELLEIHKHYILTNMTPVDSDVENQHCRLFKLGCFLWFGHLLDKDKKCKRCLKQFKNISK